MGAPGYRRIAGAAGLLALTCVPAAAQFKNPADVCFTGTGKFELDISFCSLAIRSNRHSGPNLATLLVHRGRAKTELSDLQGAVADFEAALQHNPASALAHGERGRARHKSGDFAGAVTDYDAALALNPNFGAAYRNRGTARIFQGRLADAVADFDRAIASVDYDPASRVLRGIARHLMGDQDAAVPDLSAALTQAYPYPEALLWIYLAERHAGRDGKATLAANAEAMSGGDWPDALIAVYLGESTSQAALQGTQHRHDAVSRRRLTQAHFYLGALAVANGRPGVGQRHYRAAVSLGSFDAIEHAGAMLGLRRIGKTR